MVVCCRILDGRWRDVIRPSNYRFTLFGREKATAVACRSVEKPQSWTRRRTGGLHRMGVCSLNLPELPKNFGKSIRKKWKSILQHFFIIRGAKRPRGTPRPRKHLSVRDYLSVREVPPDLRRLELMLEKANFEPKSNGKSRMRKKSIENVLEI